MRSVFLCLPLALLYGCIANDGLRSDSVAETNVVNLSRLNVGMNQSDVLRIMRQPHSQQTFEMDEAIFDIWFYVTNPTVLGQTRMVPLNLTPLAFKNGNLIGWGFIYYNYLAKRREEALNPKTPPAPPIEKIEEPKENIELEKVLQPATGQQQASPPSQEQPKRGQQPSTQQLPKQQQASPPSQEQSKKGQQPSTQQLPKQQQASPQSQENPNWGPIESPQQRPQSKPQQRPQPKPGNAKPPISMSSKPQKPDPHPPDSQPMQEQEKKKLPLNEKDEQMLEEELEQNFNQT